MTNAGKSASQLTVKVGGPVTAAGQTGNTFFPRSKVCSAFEPAVRQQGLFVDYAGRLCSSALAAYRQQFMRLDDGFGDLLRGASGAHRPFANELIGFSFG